MATVFKAVDANRDRTVAIKVLFPMLAGDQNFKTRFERELSVLLQFDHENIVPVLDYGQFGDTAYIVMPYYRAGTLEDRLKRGSLTPREGARLIGQVSSALAHAHQAGIVHRDVKPSNILLDDDGNALLTDFGLAHLVDASLSLTGSAVIGTPAYMSPEQCRGETVDERSDQYSLGVILYQICTGQLPYHADTPLAVVMQHAVEPLPPPREINTNLPEEVAEVLLRALSKDPQARFSKVAELNTAFQAALQQALRPPKGFTGHLRKALWHTRRKLLGVRLVLRDWLSSSRLRLLVAASAALLLFACPITAADLNSLITGVAGARPPDPLLMVSEGDPPADAPTGVWTQDVSSAELHSSGGNFIVGLEAPSTPSGNPPGGEGSPTEDAETTSTDDEHQEPTQQGTQPPPATDTADPSPTEASTDTPQPDPTSDPTSPPTATVSATPSPTVSSTSTASPTLTSTVTPSFTPSPTATQAGCSAGELMTGDQFAGWELRNHGSLSTRIERIYIEWPWHNEAIKSIRLGRDFPSEQVIWEGRQFPPSATIHSDWVEGADLGISTYTPLVLSFEFADYASRSGYELEVTFHNNCEASGEG
jgi:serine/threonine protein kinase